MPVSNSEPLSDRVPGASRCPRCSTTNEPSSTYCYHCGFHLENTGLAGAEFPDIPAYQGGRPAGFWIRVVAYLIDGCIITFGFSILLAISGRGFWGSADILTIEDLVAAAGSLTYYTLLVAAWGTTFGKRPFDMYLVRRDGSRVGPARAFARALAYYLSSFVLLIGFIMIGFRKDKRGLHDLICDTVVVVRKQSSPSDSP